MSVSVINSKVHLKKKKTCHHFPSCCCKPVWITFFIPSLHFLKMFSDSVFLLDSRFLLTFGTWRVFLDCVQTYKLACLSVTSVCLDMSTGYFSFKTQISCNIKHSINIHRKAKPVDDDLKNNIHHQCRLRKLLVLCISAECVNAFFFYSFPVCCCLFSCCSCMFAYKHNDMDVCVHRAGGWRVVEVIVFGVSGQQT